MKKKRKRRVRPLSPATLEYIAKKKRETPFDGRELRRDERRIRWRVLGRGEMIFYQEDEKATLFEIDAGHGTIFEKSIRVWDNGEAITDAERQRAIEVVGAEVMGTEL